MSCPDSVGLKSCQKGRHCRRTCRRHFYRGQNPPGPLLRTQCKDVDAVTSDNNWSYNRICFPQQLKAMGPLPRWAVWAASRSVSGVPWGLAESLRELAIGERNLFLLKGKACNSCLFFARPCLALLTPHFLAPSPNQVEVGPPFFWRGPGDPCWWEPTRMFRED